MNLRERLEIRALINLIISVIERLAKIFSRFFDTSTPTPPDGPVKPKRPRPLKRVVDTIDNVIPLPWRNKK